MSESNELATLRAEVERLTRERDEARAMIAESLPYLREAWDACFHGQTERLLSAEERGMGRLLTLFQAVADGKPALPPGVISTADATRQTEAAVKWAYDLLGDPNDPHPAMRRWCSPGLTAAHALKDAHAACEAAEARVEAMAAALSDLRYSIRSSPLEHFGDWRGYTPQIPESVVERIYALLAPSEPRDRAADTRIARKALDDYLAERRDSRGICPWCKLPANPPHDSIACRLRVVRSAEAEAPPPAKPCALLPADARERVRKVLDWPALADVDVDDMADAILAALGIGGVR